ncbi:regulatory protein RecX-like isoform X1 [Zingiber officinale]|uniref:regulatory protein RecX-like isoform X1 n=1 Tax=Zingiber officinale TaxID=94328 RepID=UPI001C4AE70B|nr:regulatory protein RecX-like isoform X1 [Zingiber officinale]
MMTLAAHQSFRMSLYGQFGSLITSSWTKSRCKMLGSFIMVPRKDAKIIKAVAFSSISTCKGKENNPIVRGTSRAIEDDGSFYETVHFDEDDNSMECALDNNFEVSLVEAQDSSVMTNSETVMERPIKQEAEQMAIELLAARAFTTLELRKKLRGKRYPKDVVAAVISSAKERGLLNDGLYAESFSRSRWLSSTWGPKRIKWVLVQKGVSEMEVDTATRQVFQEDDSGDKSRSTQHGISEPAFKRLYVKATKQWLQGQSSSLENRKARIVRWLQYRGFSWGVTNIILRKLLSEYPL